jgi:hypothetical protein
VKEVDEGTVGIVEAAQGSVGEGTVARWGQLRFVYSPGRATGDKRAPVRIIRPLDTEGWGGSTDSLKSTTD